MTNRIAVVLAIIIVAAIAADQLFNEGIAGVFLGRKFLGLLNWIAFWR